MSVHFVLCAGLQDQSLFSSLLLSFLDFFSLCYLHETKSQSSDQAQLGNRHSGTRLMPPSRDFASADLQERARCAGGAHGFASHHSQVLTLTEGQNRGGGSVVGGAATPEGGLEGRSAWRKASE
jgi:hypothetical protein